MAKQIGVNRGTMLRSPQVEGAPAAGRAGGGARAPPLPVSWPLQEIRLFIPGLCTGQYYS